MNKDLIIGFSSKYTEEQLQYWVTSIKKTGFSGDVVIVSDNITSNTINYLKKNNKNNCKQRNTKYNPVSFIP